MICLNSIMLLIGRIEHDVANVAGVNAGRKLLRGGQNRGNGLFVVLEVAEILFAELTIVGRDPLAIVRVGAGLGLVDEVAHGEGVVLGGAEDQRLLALIDLLHEELDAVGFTRLDLDDLVEVVFGVALAAFDFAFYHLVIGRVYGTRRGW